MHSEKFTNLWHFTTSLIPSLLSHWFFAPFFSLHRLSEFLNELHHGSLSIAEFECRIYFYNLLIYKYFLYNDLFIKSWVDCPNKQNAAALASYFCWRPDLHMDEQCLQKRSLSCHVTMKLTSKPKAFEIGIIFWITSYYLQNFYT